MKEPKYFTFSFAVGRWISVGFRDADDKDDDDDDSDDDDDHFKLQ